MISNQSLSKICSSKFLLSISKFWRAGVSHGFRVSFSFSDWTKLIFFVVSVIWCKNKWPWWLFENFGPRLPCNAFALRSHSATEKNNKACPSLFNDWKHGNHTFLQTVKGISFKTYLQQTITFQSPSAQIFGEEYSVLGWKLIPRGLNLCLIYSNTWRFTLWVWPSKGDVRLLHHIFIFWDFYLQPQ